MNLVGTIAKDIEAQIQMNPDIQLSEEELVELFQKKMNILDIWLLSQSWQLFLSCSLIPLHF